MKDKIIRTAPPSMLFLTCFFDAAVIGFLGIAVYGVIKAVSFFTIGFLVIEIIIAVVAALMTKEVLKAGVIFKSDSVEFTWLDEDNTYRYDEIESIETHKDNASLKKNLVERYSSVIFHLKDGSVATVEFGVTTKRKLKTVENEIKERMV